MAIEFKRSYAVTDNNVRSDGELTKVMDALTTEGFSSNYRGASFAAVKVVILATGVSGASTFKFWSSSQALEPDFTNSPSDTNLIALNTVINTANPSGADSSSAVASFDIDADGVFEFVYNDNYARWFNVELNAHSGGTFTVLFIGSNL